MGKIELPEGWDGVAEPLRSLVAELEREAQAGASSAPDPAAFSARWARMSDAVRAAVRTRIADMQAD